MTRPPPLVILLSIPSVVFFLITLIRRRYHLRKGARADAATPVSGIVIADGKDPVIELVLELYTPRTRSVGLSVEEKERSVLARPFIVKTDAGEQIDIAPEGDVKVYATLGKAKKVKEQYFKKTASVRPGQHVYMLGQLREAESPADGPFREGERTRPHFSPTLVSTSKIGSTARMWADNDKTWLKRWAVIALFGPLPYLFGIVGFFIVGFWVRDMIVAKIWWEEKRYSEYYGTGTTHEDRKEYD